MAVFGKEPPDKGQRVIVEIIRRVNDNIRRLRILEQKIKAIESHVNSTDENVLTLQKSFQKAINERDMRITGIEDKLQKLDTLTKEILKQMKMVATKSGLEEIRNTMNILNPVNSNFVTRNEVREMLKSYKKVDQ
jgi:vacuolar-type H+-ATPase subunit I/STV1